MTPNIRGIIGRTSARSLFSSILRTIVVAGVILCFFVGCACFIGYEDGVVQWIFSRLHLPSSLGLVLESITHQNNVSQPYRILPHFGVHLEIDKNNNTINQHSRLFLQRRQLQEQKPQQSVLSFITFKTIPRHPPPPGTVVKEIHQSPQFVQFMAWVKRFRARHNRTWAPTPVDSLSPTNVPDVKPPIRAPNIAPFRAPTQVPIRAPIRGNPTPPTPIASLSPVYLSPTSKPVPPDSGVGRCGCRSCTKLIWNRDADGFTCWDRIQWVISNDPSVSGSEEASCRVVADQFPSVCGPSCHPDKCDNGETSPTQAPTNSKGDIDLYCFPRIPDRTQYNNVWSGQYTVEVKESGIQTDGVCGPSYNRFSTETVSLNSDRTELTLQFKKINGMWTASEVRVIIPNSTMLFDYGTYRISIKSIAVISKIKNPLNSNTEATSSVRSNILPPSMVLGFFTWDSTDDYSIRENYNREVDIELSRWKKPGNKQPDGMFLVQPNGPHKHYFFTGPNKTMDPGSGNTYEFTWNPGAIFWSTTAGGGVKFNFTTAQAVKLGEPDYVQCLPNHVEIRLNLWNLLGTNTPMEIESDDEIIEAIIDDFSYVPSGLSGLNDGQTCTRDCQCLPTISYCDNTVNVCKPR